MPGFDFNAQPLDAFGAGGGERDGKLSDLVLDGVEPARIAHAFLEQTVARAQRALEGRDTRAVSGVDRKHQTVEKTPPLAGGTEKKPIHFRHQPDDAQVLGKLHRGRDVFMRDAGAANGRFVLRRRVDAGAEPHFAFGAIDRRRHRPGTVTVAGGRVLQCRAAKAAARREIRDRFENVGLARAVLAKKDDRTFAESEIGTSIGAEIRELQAADTRGGAQYGPRFG